MTMIIIIQAVIFTTYIVYVWRKVGIQKSISESYYSLKPYNQQFAFTAFCMIVGLLHLFHSQNHGWYFISGSGLVFAGVAAEFKQWKTTNYVHYTGAVVAILGSTIGLWIDGNRYTCIPIIAVIVLSFIIPIKNKLWWIEVTAFFSIIFFISLK